MRLLIGVNLKVLDEVPLGQFAVKAIPVGTSHAWLVRMLKEVHLLERLRHPNIIEYKHAWLENRQPTLFGNLVIVHRIQQNDLILGRQQVPRYHAYSSLWNWQMETI